MLPRTKKATVYIDGGLALARPVRGGYRRAKPFITVNLKEQLLPGTFELKEKSGKRDGGTKEQRNNIPANSLTFSPKRGRVSCTA